MESEGIPHRRKTEQAGMKKKRRRRTKAAAAKKPVVIGILVFLAVLTGTTLWYGSKSGPIPQPEEVRGVWLAYVDCKPLGLYNKSKQEFTDNAQRFFKSCEKNKINTIYFHVRAFRDAAYPSEKFPMSRYLWDRAEPIPYDPLKIMTDLAHKHEMQLHAWLNPYRGESLEAKILNPAKKASEQEILSCVDEILESYPVDGIHFDDYFYKEGAKGSNEKKAEHVNRMVRKVYQRVKSYGEDIQFGISPAGNISYCESIGADVKTWLGTSGYVDYVMPQLYWTDNHSASWRKHMFTDTLKEWISLNKNNIPLYPGLALYRAGEKGSDDPGWEKSGGNIARQVEILRQQGCKGYALFSAKDFYRKGAKKELRNYRKKW